MSEITATPGKRQPGLDSWLGRHVLAVLSGVAPRLSPRAAWRLGRVLGWLAPRLTPHRVRRVRDEMTLALGDRCTPADIHTLAERFYRELGVSLVEFLRLPAMSPAAIAASVRYEGIEHLDAALARGKGVILFTAHLGNWEIGSALLGIIDYPVTAIAHPQHVPLLDALFSRLREAHGLRVVLDTDLRGCIEVLKRNECLAIVGDVNARTPGAFVNFFGRPAATHTGAAYLARLTGAVVLPLFDTRQSNGTHLLRIDPPIEMVVTGDRRQDLLVNTIRLQRVIEAEVRRRPHEWFWLLQRWKTRPEDVPNPERVPMEHRDMPDAPIPGTTPEMPPTTR